MRSLRIVVHASLFAVVVVQGVYVHGARVAIRDLERRVSNLSEDGEHPAVLPGGAARGAGAAPAAALASLVVAARGADPEQLRRLVTEQLHALQADARAAQVQHEDDAMARGRAQIASTVGLSDAELRRLEELGAPLQEAQEKFLRGESQGKDDYDALTRLDRQTEQQVQALLGDDRYRKLETVRREHPEYARYVMAMRLPGYEPTPIGAAELPSGGAVATP